MMKQQKPKKRLTSLVIVGVVLIVATGLSVFLQQQSVLRAERSAAQEVESALRTQIEVLQKQIDEGASNIQNNKPQRTVFTQKVAKQVVENANWTSLLDYTKNPVTLVLAASDGLGPRNQTQLVNDLKILESAAGPWNFTLPSAVIQEYQVGDYAQFFQGDERVIGRSSDGYVIVFGLGEDNKISEIFISTNEELL